jgi:hypothetical protein
MLLGFDRLEPAGPARLALRFGPRALLIITAPLLAICLVLGGFRAVIGGAIGLLVVAGFFTVSVLAVEAANRVDPALTLPVALTTYVIKIVLLGAAAFAVPRSLGSARAAFAAALVVGTLAWLIAQAVGVWRARITYIDVDAIPERPPSRDWQ